MATGDVRPLPSWRELSGRTRVVGYVLFAGLAVFLVCFALAWTAVSAGFEPLTAAEKKAVAIRFMLLWGACVVSLVPANATAAFAPQRVVDVYLFLLSCVWLGHSWLYRFVGSRFSRVMVRVAGIMGTLTTPVMLFSWASMLQIIMSDPS